MFEKLLCIEPRLILMWTETKYFA